MESEAKKEEISRFILEDSDEEDFPNPWTSRFSTISKESVSFLCFILFYF